jgi:hypothetical protein
MEKTRMILERNQRAVRAIPKATGPAKGGHWEVMEVDAH